MEIVAVQKFIRVSPKKMREVADVARKLSPQTAVDQLPFLRKRGSEVLLKVIKTALASARQKGISDTTLVFKEIQIGEGPRLKRGRAASRGRWHPYKRRMSHVRVVLLTVEKQIDPKDAKEKEAPEKKEDKPESLPKTDEKTVNGILSKVRKSAVHKEKGNKK